MTSHLLHKSPHSHHAENDMRFGKRWMQTAPLLQCFQGNVRAELSPVCACVFRRDIQPSNWFKSFHSRQLAVTETTAPCVDVFLFFFPAMTYSHMTWCCHCQQTHVIVWVNCSSMHFHAHLRGDGRHAFNSHKYGAAPMPFPVLVVSCLSSNFNKQFQVNLPLCWNWRKKKKLLQSVFIYFCEEDTPILYTKSSEAPKLLWKHGISFLPSFVVTCCLNVFFFGNYAETLYQSRGRANKHTMSSCTHSNTHSLWRAMHWLTTAI